MPGGGLRAALPGLEEDRPGEPGPTSTKIRQSARRVTRSPASPQAESRPSTDRAGRGRAPGGLAGFFRRPRSGKREESVVDRVTRSLVLTEETPTMSSGIESSRVAAGRRRRVAGRRRDGPRPGPAQGRDQEGPLLHQELGLPALGHHPRRRQAQPGRADPDRDRQGARLRGRRLQGRPDVRARQDRRVGRLRLRDHRRPDDPGHRQDGPPMSPDGEKAFYDAIRGGKGFVGMHCATDTFGHHARGTRAPRTPTSR